MKCYLNFRIKWTQTLVNDPENLKWNQKFKKIIKEEQQVNVSAVKKQVYLKSRYQVNLDRPSEQVKKI